MKEKNVRPFFVLLLCALLQGGTLGIISNCRGIFISPVCSELGFTIGELTSYSVFYGIAVCVAVPFAAKAIRKANLRAVLTACALVVSITEYVMYSFTRLHHWYVASTIQGVCYAFLVVLTVPMLINNWFATNKGTFMGVASISSGLVGALMNSLAGRVITEYGWRSGYRFLGLVLFLLLVPGCMLFSWRSPADVCARPFGAQSGLPVPQQAGMTAKSAMRTPAFYLLMVYACIICGTVGYNQALASMAESFGYPQASLPGFVSVALLGTVFFKMLVGRLIDSRGAKAACFLATGGIAFGFLTLLFGVSPVAMYAGAFFMGIPMATSVVLIQAMVRRMFGGAAFETIYAPVSVAINLSSNFSFSLIGWIISASGSYLVSIYTGLCIAIIAFGVAAILFGYKKGGFICERSN